MSAVDLPDIGTADNPEPRCPCVLLLDTSGSMAGEPIAALNSGLTAFQKEVNADTLAARRVEVAIVTFGGTVQVVQDFVTVDSFTPPTLITGGQTPMATAVNKAIDLLEDRKAAYKATGLFYYRPWVFMITDGAPTDPEPAIQSAANRLLQQQRASKLVFFAVGTEGADFSRLTTFTLPERPPARLRGLQFVELFVWLSRSQQAVAQSQPGQQVALPPAGGWQAV